MSWINQTISHYKILEKLGEGGMGVVYKAEDTKLERLVALKFLPQHIIANKADKDRFLQEAKAASAINHPNVCVIYDIQEHEGQQFIVMEYVDGETLGAKIKSGQIPLKDVTNYAIQIAEALQAAHKKGIIHRDIKPENIMVNSSNQIKVMDFGLARLKGSLKLTKSTSTGGTLSYMAPEQIEGTNIDARSDIFSFGVVLYEMLTRYLPFRGDYETAMMYSILNEEPEPVQSYRTDLSTEYLHVLNRSLKKDPEDRYQYAPDIAIDLKHILWDSKRVSRKTLHRLSKEESETPPTKDNKNKYGKPMIRVLVPLVSMIVIFIALDLLFFKKTDDKTTETMTISKFTSYIGEVTEPAFSPDGNDIAFCWTGEENKNQNLYVKTVGVREFEPRQITFGDMNDYHPAWSPDRKYIAFHRIERVNESFMLKGQADIYTIPANGGQERKLTFGWQPDWSPDGHSLVFCDFDTVIRTMFISMLELRTLEKKVLVQPDSFSYAFYPIFSPDGEKMAFLKTSHPGSPAYPDELYIVSSSGGQPEQLTFDNADIRALTWTPDSRNIVFSSNRGGTFALWELSLGNREVQSISISGERCTDPKISPDGSKLCYIAINNQRKIWDIDRIDITATAIDKKAPIQQIITESDKTKNAEYSPDGQEIVFISRRLGTTEIWKCDKEGRSAIQLTSLKCPRVVGPRWSPDGKWICFDAAVEKNRSIFKIRAEGGPAIRLTSGFTDDRYPFWSSDGKWIYYFSNDYKKSVTKKILADAPLSEPKYVIDEYVIGESADGKYLYFDKLNNGNIALYKKLLQSGQEEMVFCPKDHGIEADRWIFRDYSCDLFDNGIYFIGCDEKKTGIVWFYDFETQAVNTICAVSCLPRNIDVSPDQKYLLKTTLNEKKENINISNIWLVENFR